MKFKVIESFVDKHTQEVYEKGSIVEFTGARAKEIRTAGDFIEKCVAKQVEK